MNILKLAFELFLIYILYKFIFEFIIPVYKASKQVRQKMNDMHQRMQETQARPDNEEYNYNTRNQSTAAPKRPASDDYIEYEEVK